jgi:Cys-tRNA(Pro)/Cys-tRNA(Cys) deacylase|tara:strand:+ start:1251 stop:1715 length:465 start_codon:yes stop_codon:yes gene_type:complete
MTPAIDQLISLGVHHKLHQYTHDPQAASYGNEAAEKLAVTVQQVFKTLVVDTGHKVLAVAIVPVDQQLNLKLLAKALGVKKVVMAEPVLVSRSTGYVLGGVSPMGQKRALTTVIDTSAEDHASIYVSGGRRGLEIELSACDLAMATHGQFAVIT